MRTRTIAFTSDGLALSGELVVPDEPRSLVVLCHGIPSGAPPDPGDAGYAGLARDVAARGHAAFWFDFRGCRQSPGDFSMAGWVRDLDAAVDALTAQPERAGLPLVLAGASASGPVSIAVAARRADVAAVATFASVSSWRLDDLATDTRSLIGDFRNRGILRDPTYPPDPQAWAAEFDEYAADALVERLDGKPLLLVHGDADTIVGYLHAERLFSRAGAPKELVRLPGGGHQLRRDPRAVEALVDWLDRHVRLLPV